MLPKQPLLFSIHVHDAITRYRTHLGKLMSRPLAAMRHISHHKFTPLQYLRHNFLTIYIAKVLAPREITINLPLKINDIFKWKHITVELAIETRWKTIDMTSVDLRLPFVNVRFCVIIIICMMGECVPWLARRVYQSKWKWRNNKHACAFFLCKSWILLHR